MRDAGRAADPYHVLATAMIAMLIQAFYNIVDSFFVSMISEQALAADYIYVFPIDLCGFHHHRNEREINSLISRRLGAKLYEEADMAANHGYRLSFFNWMFFALIGIFLSSPFMHLMSNTPFIVESDLKYMAIITIGSLFCIVQMTTEKILQATGNMISFHGLVASSEVFQYYIRSAVYFRYRPFRSWALQVLL